jgi:hypothetical protein
VVVSAVEASAAPFEVLGIALDALRNIVPDPRVVTSRAGTVRPDETELASVKLVSALFRLKRR